MNDSSEDADRVQAAWWEKTVEYAFIRDVLPSAHEAFPLDGNAEKAYGDLVTKGSVGYRLIEFKATRGDIWSEKKKYASFLKVDDDVGRAFHLLLAHCEPSIVSHAGCRAHWIIYGQPLPDRTGFALEARPYAGDGENVIALASNKDLEQLETVTYEVLHDYLVELEGARGSSVGTGTAAATGGGLLIVGVKGGKTVALTEEEFRLPYPRPTLEQEAAFDAEYESPNNQNCYSPSTPGF